MAQEARRRDGARQEEGGTEQRQRVERQQRRRLGRRRRRSQLARLVVARVIASRHTPCTVPESRRSRNTFLLLVIEDGG